MAPKGKYFLIKSKHNGLYLDVKGASTAPRSPVVLWNKNGNDNQTWYHDPLTKTIRGKQSNLCLDIQGDRLCINTHQPGRAEQQWVYNSKSNAIENLAQAGKVLDVVGAAKNAGAEVCSYATHGKDNQKWELDFCPVKYFVLRSGACDKVLDVTGANKNPGAKVILYQKKAGHSDNQLWYEDSYGNIRTKLNEKLCLDGRSGCLQTGNFEMGGNRTFWALNGNIIRSVYNPTEVLDLKGGATENGTEICVWNHHGRPNQQWHCDFV